MTPDVILLAVCYSSVLSSENLPPPTFFSVVIMAAKLLSGTIGTNSMDSQCKKINGLNIAEREMSAGLPSPR